MTQFNSFLLQGFIFFILFTITHSLSSPLNCTDTARLCTSFLAFKPSPAQTLPVLQSMFDALPGDITAERNDLDQIQAVFIKKNCFCAPTDDVYLTNTTFTVRAVQRALSEAYQGLAFLPRGARGRKPRVGAVVSLHLLCGCSSGLWNYLMSYVMGDGDTIDSLASRFGVSMDSIESVNGIANPDNVSIGGLYYVPLNSVPGEPYPLVEKISPAPVPEPSADTFIEKQVTRKTHFPYAWTIGGSAAGLLLIFIAILMCISFKSSSCCRQSTRSRTKYPDGKTPHKFHILGRSSFCCASATSVSTKSKDWNPSNGESVNRQANIPKAVGADVFDMEKPVVFTYEEVLSSTDCFADTNLLGHGTYGSVYYGVLHDQEVAIKRMAAMKTKEFMAEMKVLCKVHHTNLN